MDIGIKVRTVEVEFNGIGFVHVAHERIIFEYSDICQD